MLDYYKILGLPFGANSSQIKAAYRQLAFKYHPDKNSNNKFAEEKFKEITEAYSILSDKEKSLMYHAQYAEFIKQQNNPKQSIPEPKIKVHPFYRNIVNTERRYASGKASKRTIDWNLYNISALVLFVAFILFMLVSSFREIKERESQQYKKSISAATDTVIKKEKSKITKEEYFELLAMEYADSKDSTLYKINNIDSMMRVIDSLNIFNQ